MTEPTLVGLITAAGESTRMGGLAKPLLTVDGQQFVERLTEQYHEAGVGEFRRASVATRRSGFAALRT